MTSAAALQGFGVALLAPRMCSLGEDPCGGSEVVLWEDAAMLKEAGIPVRVYAQAARKGAPVSVIPLRTNARLITSLEYGGRLLYREPKARLIAYNEPALAGWAPARTIARFDWETPLPKYWNWPVWLSRFQNARYLFPSESERRLFLLRHNRIPDRSTVMIQNAVDLQLFHPAGGYPSANSLNVGFAGQWVARKGMEVLLEAWRSVKLAMPAANLYLAGGPGLWKNVSATAGAEESIAPIQQMEKEGLLYPLGALPRSKMPKFWSSVGIAVVPSLYEPFGLVALEALACGVPVVATTAGGLKEIVIDGESGLLVPVGDAVALAQAVLCLLTNEPLRLQLAAGARRRAETFSRERRSRELLRLLLGPDPQSLQA